MKTLAFAACIATAIIINAGAWFGGFNFDKRGEDALCVFVVTVVSSAFIWAMVYDLTKKR